MRPRTRSTSSHGASFAGLTEISRSAGVMSMARNCRSATTRRQGGGLQRRSRRLARCGTAIHWFCQNLYTERTVVSPPTPSVPPIVTTARVRPSSASVSTMVAPCAAAISSAIASPRPADPYPGSEAEPAHAVPPVPVRAQSRRAEQLVQLGRSARSAPGAGVANGTRPRQTA